MWGKKAAKPPPPKAGGGSDDEEDEVPEGEITPAAVSKKARESGEQLIIRMSSESTPSPLERAKMFVDGESILVVSSKGTYDVDRRIGSLSYMPLSIAPSGRQGRDIDVILGIARFQTEQFLVVASDSMLVGLVETSRVYCLRQVDFVPFELYASASTKSKSEDIVKRIAALEKLLSTGGFFFSPDMDITRHVIPFKGKHAPEKGAPKSIHAPNERFFWNLEWCYDFEALPDGARAFLTPLMHGTVSYEEVSVPYPEKARLCLLCRRARAMSWRSAKGLGKDGQAAGMIECEQVFFLPSETVTVTHVAVRASCPCLWEQSRRTNNEVKVLPDHESKGEAGLGSHIKDLEEAYNRVLFISMLCPARPEEALLQSALVAAARALVKVTNGTEGGRRPEQLIAFDLASRRGTTFREVCSEIEGLLKVAPPSCAVSAPGGACGLTQQQQDFVWRTSCLDGVDRSHTMQASCTMLALTGIFQLLGLCDHGVPAKNLDDSIRNIWGQSGENLYRQVYSADPSSLQSSELLIPPTAGSKDGTWSSGWSSTLRAVAKLTTFEGTDEYELMHAATLGGGIGNFQKWQLHSEIMTKEEELWIKTPLRVFTGTWNLAGSPWKKGNDLAKWIEPATRQWGGSGGADLYVFGFQEIVNLDTMNVLKDTSKGFFQMSGAIYGDISSILAGKDTDQGPKSVTTESAASEVVDENIKLWQREMADALSGTGTEYKMIASRQLVGVLLCIFAKTSLAPKIKDMAIDHCKTGLGGMAGNKGGVAVRFNIGLTSMCFLCGHFAAHLKHVKARNRDYETVTQSLKFPMHKPQLHPQKALDAAKTQSYPNPGHALGHDIVVWLGDFNYRIDTISSEEIKAAVANGDLARLQQLDQLIREKGEGRVLSGFSEGNLSFTPTYKFDSGTDVYDTSPKARAPAWCDRVLFKGRNVDLKEYSSVMDMRFSDHKPVVALLEVETQHVGAHSEGLLVDVIAKASEVVKVRMNEVLGGGKSSAKWDHEFEDAADDAAQGNLIDLA